MKSLISVLRYWLFKNHNSVSKQGKLWDLKWKVPEPPKRCCPTGEAG
jgi:hypothetical protein